MAARNSEFGKGSGTPSSRIGAKDLSTEEFNALPYDDQMRHITAISGMGTPEPSAESGASKGTRLPKAPALKTDINEVYAAAPRTRAQRTAEASSASSGTTPAQAAKDQKAKLRDAQQTERQAIKSKINARRTSVTPNPDAEAEGEAPKIGTSEALSRLIDIHNQIDAHYKSIPEKVASEIAYHQGEAAKFGGEPHAKHVEDLKQALEQHNAGIKATKTGTSPSLLANNLVEARALLNTASGEQNNRNTSISVDHIKRAAFKLKDELSRMGNTRLGRLGVLPQGSQRADIDSIASGVKGVQSKAVRYDTYVDDHPLYGPSKPGHVWVGNPNAIAGSPSGIRQVPLTETAHTDFLAKNPGVTKASTSYMNIVDAQRNAKQSSESSVYRGSSTGASGVSKEAVSTEAKLPKSETDTDEEGNPTANAPDRLIKKEDMVDASGAPVYKKVNGVLFKIAGAKAVEGQKLASTRNPKPKKSWRDTRITPAEVTTATVPELGAMSREHRTNYFKMNADERAQFVKLTPEDKDTFISNRAKARG
jgi:hypothetical protein